MLLIVFTLCISACKREERDFPSDDATNAPPETTQSLRLTTLVPGLPDATSSSATTSPSTSTAASTTAPDQVLPQEVKYQRNAYAQSQGQMLFSDFNCVGCHAHGGGGMGPALMDQQWIYGSDPIQIYATIVQGRPNGMPAFGNKIAEDQIWQLVAYVRSLSGLTPMNAAQGRPDHMQVRPSPQTTSANHKPVQPTSRPVQSGTTHSAEMPQ